MTEIFVIKYFCSCINIFAVPQTAAVCVREADQHHAGDPRAAGVPQPPRQEELPHPLPAAQHQEQAPQPEEVHLRCPRGKSLLIRENTFNALSFLTLPIIWLYIIIIINRRETRNINPVDCSSRYILYSYRDKAWA